jgi:hypothetical protein
MATDVRELIEGRKLRSDKGKRHQSKKKLSTTNPIPYAFESANLLKLGIKRGK